jgi:valyl-tRNA synthetase
MPFLTEEIWQALPHGSTQDSIMICRYPLPQAEWDTKEIETQFATLERFVNTVRAGRALLEYSPSARLTLYGNAKEQNERTSLEGLLSILEQLSRASVSIAPSDTWPAEKVLQLVTEGLTVGIRVEGDVDLRKVLDRLVKQATDAKKEALRLEGKLSNTEFVSKAPAEVVAEHRQRIATLAHEQSMLASSEQQLRRMF